MASPAKDKISSAGQGAATATTNTFEKSQAATMKAFDSAKRSIQDFQKVIDDTKEKIKPAVENTIKILKLLAIGILGMADIMILQLILVIFTSNNILLSLLFTQIYMTIFFIFPSLVIFKYPVSTG